MSYMNMTITIRTDDTLRTALERRAAAEGKTLSVLAREILSAALAERPLKTRAGGLKGRLGLRRTAPAPWRENLRGHNWRR
jgi:plasmid stability protein